MTQVAGALVIVDDDYSTVISQARFEDPWKELEIVGRPQLAAAMEKWQRSGETEGSRAAAGGPAAVVTVVRLLHLFLYSPLSIRLSREMHSPQLIKTLNNIATGSLDFGSLDFN